MLTFRPNVVKIMASTFVNKFCSASSFGIISTYCCLLPVVNHKTRQNQCSNCTYKTTKKNFKGSSINDVTTKGEVG